jgi:type VI secretion system protein ImpG
MFSKYYQSELSFLRAMGKAFAEVNPSVAGMLAERGGDPDVERLLEGVAFLTARIRERLDDSVPEMVHDLTELLLPHYLRPLPACSIVEFQPIPGALRARARIARHAELASIPVEGTACRFRTSADLDLLPVAVQDVSMDQAISANPVIRIHLAAAAPALPTLFQPEGIRFFIQGELPVASTLLLWLARHLKAVQVKGLGPSGRAVQLGPRAVRLCGFDREMPLLPWPRMAPIGYRNLQEYFALPQKFLFFEIRDLHLAKSVAEERFEIAFQFERPPELPSRVVSDTFHVNCVPVVNLFKTAGDPIGLEALGEQHLVRAAEIRPNHMEIYAIDSVLGLPDAQGQRVTYDPFFGFGHGSGGERVGYYRVRRVHSPIDDGIDSYLSVNRGRDAGVGPAEETLSIELTCTNRSLAGQLKLGEISAPTPTSPTIARFRNVVAVTKPIRPPLGTELHWRLLAHLASNRVSLSDVGTLRTLLDLYNFQAFVDQQTGRANRLRIEGIRSAESSSVRRVVGGAPLRGSRLMLDVEEANFASLGDAFIFSSAIEEVIASQVSINSFAELGIRLQPSQREYGWPARNGGRALV